MSSARLCVFILRLSLHIIHPSYICQDMPRSAHDLVEHRPKLVECFEDLRS